MAKQRDDTSVISKADAIQEKGLEVVVELTKDDKDRVVNMTFRGFTMEEAIKKIMKVDRYDRVVDISHLR